jgi:hypothetical protein
MNRRFAHAAIIATRPDPGPARPLGVDPLPEAYLRAADGPHRHPHAGAAGGIPKVVGYKTKTDWEILCLGSSLSILNQSRQAPIATVC